MQTVASVKYFLTIFVTAVTFASGFAVKPWSEVRQNETIERIFKNERTYLRISKDYQGINYLGAYMFPKLRRILEVMVRQTMTASDFKTIFEAFDDISLLKGAQGELDRLSNLEFSGDREPPARDIISLGNLRYAPEKPGASHIKEREKLKFLLVKGKKLEKFIADFSQQDAAFNFEELTAESQKRLRKCYDTFRGMKFKGFEYTEPRIFAYFRGSFEGVENRPISMESFLALMEKFEQIDKKEGNIKLRSNNERARDTYRTFHP